MRNSLRSLASVPLLSLVLLAVALFVAVGGPAQAAPLITGAKVKDNSLTGRDVRANTLTGSDVRGIRGGDIRDGSLPEFGFDVSAQKARSAARPLPDGIDSRQNGPL